MTEKQKCDRCNHKQCDSPCLGDFFFSVTTPLGEEKISGRRKLCAGCMTDFLSAFDMALQIAEGLLDAVNQVEEQKSQPKNTGELH